MRATCTELRRYLAGAVLLCAAGLTVLVPTPAWAHAALVDSSPHQGEQFDELPAQVRFEFSQDMSAPAYVIVTAPDGSSVTTGDPQVDGPVVSQDITDGPDGTYTMAYRAVSEDGHPVTGEITFLVGSGSTSTGSPESGPSAAEPGPDDASIGDAPEAATDDSFVSRHLVAVSVGIALFLLAGLMLLLARRTAP